MKHFTGIEDIGDLNALVQDALEFSKNPLTHTHLGTGKTLGLLFMNPSLRTRLSSQIAAENIGLRPTVVDASNGWNLELQRDVIMDTDKAEHIIEAAGVLGAYFDILGMRSFPTLSDLEFDYNEELLHMVKRHCKVPLISLESATGHPLQSLADLVTIAQFKKSENPKIVLTWSPHPRTLPQAVANTFSQFVLAAGYDLTISHPPEMDLNPHFTHGARIVHDQDEALRDADFVYVKNWSSYSSYGQSASVGGGYEDWQITMDKLSLTNQAKVMHCLPVRRNVVIHQDVLDSDSSIVIPQARNRIFSAQAVLKNIVESL